MVDFVSIFSKQLLLFLLLMMVIPVSCAGNEISNIPTGYEKTTNGLDITNTTFEIQKTNTVIKTNDENNDWVEIPTDVPAEISQDNLEEIQEIARISPFYVPHFEISSDGASFVVGTEQAVFIVDGFSGETISEIPAKPYECNFGMGRYFRLNENGNFLGIVNDNSIEVWQVGGGKIHETEFNWKMDAGQTSCGGYIPEISISPNGDLLAVSGKEYINGTPEQTFRVIDIPRNEVIYEWDGEEESLHGNLYTYPGLGFSADGKYIQTFDPTRFIRPQNGTHLAFRFWEVGDWRVPSKRDFRIRDSYPIGNLFYSLSYERGLDIRTKLDGSLISRLEMEECSFEYPCETKFSLDGNYLAILKQKDNQLLFRNQIFFKDVEIWDIDQENRTILANSLFRNLDGIHPDFPETISRIEKWLQDKKNKSFWWISDIYFDGLKKSADGKIYFTPRRSELEKNGGCDFCTICQQDYPSMNFVCEEGLLGFGGQKLKIDTTDGFPVIMIHDEKLRIVGELPFIILNNLNQNNFHLLGFSEKYQIGFFCADENFREKRCAVYDFIGREPLFEIEDISYLRASSDGKKAAFINVRKGRLFIYDLEKNEIWEKTAYQSRAASVNPVFNGNSTIIYYMIQNLENSSNHSFDVIDMSTGKVLKRIDFEDFNTGKATAFAVNSDETIFAVGGDGGEVQLVVSSDGSLRHQWPAHEDRIAGIEFVSGSKELITIGQNGIIKIWNIGK